MALERRRLQRFVIDNITLSAEANSDCEMLSNILDGFVGIRFSTG